MFPQRLASNNEEFLLVPTGATQLSAIEGLSAPLLSRLEWLNLLPRTIRPATVSAALTAIENAQLSGPEGDPERLAETLLGIDDTAMVVGMLLAWITLDDTVSEWSGEIAARTMQSLAQSGRRPDLQTEIFRWTGEFLPRATTSHARRLASFFGSLIEHQVISLKDLLRYLTARGLSHRTAIDDKAFCLQEFLALIPLPTCDDALRQQRDALIGPLNSGTTPGDRQLLLADTALTSDGNRRLAWRLEQAQDWRSLRLVSDVCIA